MQCPNCLGDVPSAAKACRRCGHAFSEGQLEKQAAFEKRAKMAAPYVSGLAILTVLVLLWTCTRQQAAQPLTPSERVEAGRKASSDKLAVLEYRAEGTAAEAVKQRLNDPASFELVGASAMPGKTDDGSPGWIVGVTYRAKNGFGAVMTNNAIVSVDQQGEAALKIIDIR
ncbi:hypothetical protein [Sphingomonas radiodurans]|uniref:hypothetical protein n=1 Tax=Sphingomonas radiodurans TaxID=2890321 RepID=UPI001E3688A9|nr:hypothetical protein [Sphingomonas radiodurans]WBH16502.1 hypothetical protein LLW23_17225 [Sphingomonas radiodurans]